MSAGVAQSLTLTTSHEKQRDAWRQCKGGWNAEQQVTRLLTEQTMRLDDPMLVFVGQTAYEQAGGTVRLDLFSKHDGAGFAQDPALVRKLAAAKLEAEGEKIKAAEGWAFVMHELQENADAYSYRREQPTRREATKEEADRRAQIEQELTALEDEGWDDQTPEGRAVARQWNRLEAEHEALEARRETWTPEQKQRCGVWLGITTYGKIEQRRGFVDPAWDKKQREEAEAQRAEQEKPVARVRLEGAGAGRKPSSDATANR